MTFETCNFNVPEYVSSADPGKFDTSAPGAVVVGGFRLDNPAAVWMAGAEVRKNASAIDAATRSRITTACELFGIGDDQYTLAKVASSVTVSDGENTAEFSIYDSESLNSAAKTLLNKRASLPYAFAHDCAVALNDEAKANGYEFESDVQVPIRKLAGDYTVDFNAGKALLNKAAEEAKSLGMTEHSEVLNKLASMCSDDCTADMAPYFIVALDEFNRSTVRKEASENPENTFYLSNSEVAARYNEQKLFFDTNRAVTRGEIHSNSSNISKWASMCGYSLNPSDPDSVVSAVSKMPNALKDEFAELFK